MPGLSPRQLGKVTTDEPQKLAYRIDEAVKASGLGRSFIYERIADGTLKSVKIGGRRLILREDLLAFLKHESKDFLKALPRTESVNSVLRQAKHDVTVLPGQMQLPLSIPNVRRR